MVSNRQLFLRHVAQTSESSLQFEIERAEGISFFDTRGKAYIDLVSGVSVSALGHGHPVVVKAVQDQAERYMHTMVYGEFVQSPQVEYASWLAERLPASLDNVYFVNSGSEAIDGAMKLAKRVTGKGEFFAFEALNIGEYIDVCTVAKTLQCAATLYTEEMNPQPGLIAGTFSGSSAALSAGLEILNVLDDEGYMGESGRIQKIHNEFVGMLNRLNETSCKGLLQDAGGRGLMVAVTPLDGSKEKMMELLKVLYKNGLMTFGCGKGPFRLRFLLPAVLEDKDIEVAGQILEKSIQELV